MATFVYSPCERLRPYVQAITVLESPDPVTFRILPDTSIVMGVQFKGRVSFTGRLLSTAGITGIHNTYRMVSNTPDTGSVLVRFTSTGAAQFFHIPMQDVYNDSIAFNDFIPKTTGCLEEQLAEAPDNDTRVKIIESWLLTRLLPKKADTLIAAAVDRLHHENGLIRIADLSKELFISQSQLERRFRAIVGTTPKKFASIIRLQNVIQKGQHNTGDLTSLSYDSGYFDQAHFIHDFTSFTGTTPSEFFLHNLPQ